MGSKKDILSEMIAQAMIDMADEFDKGVPCEIDRQLERVGLFGSNLYWTAIKEGIDDEDRLLEEFKGHPPI
jgi:hypothetical protein